MIGVERVDLLGAPQAVSGGEEKFVSLLPFQQTGFFERSPTEPQIIKIFTGGQLQRALVDGDAVVPKLECDIPGLRIGAKRPRPAVKLLPPFVNHVGVNHFQIGVVDPPEGEGEQQEDSGEAGDRPPAVGFSSSPPNKDNADQKQEKKEVDIIFDNR